MARNAVARYIEKNCANYDANGQCLLQTFESGSHICPLFFSLNSRCNYAETSVLPGDEHIQALYMQGKQGAEIILNTCERCKKPYKRKSNRQKYCPVCQADQARKRSREGMAKSRANVNG
ncbi:cysteine-rich VLP protein [Rummeliibacillus suwonensis]|uniref:cysteine-rich VLP protein n=1 Tax=Rummeliibacillus suwonensis TaxID=1306154 RepID=UPI0011B5D0F1